MGPFRTVYDVELKNRQAGYHFFDADAKRFFRSRIGTEMINGRYFITSEQFVGSNHVAAPRRYTIRRAEDNGNINTVGEFGQYAAGAQARRAAEKLHDVASPCANCRKQTYNPNYTCDACQREHNA